MNFGRIITAECQNTAPPPDARCSDPAFALANPDICAIAPRLVIKPGVSLLCVLDSVQFSAVAIENGNEIDVTGSAIFTSSNPNVAVIGAHSGNATGLSAGTATISATYNGMTVQAEMTVLAGDNCCEELTTAIMVLVDNSKSMSQTFSGTYTSKLAYAKVAATRLIEEVNATKDVVGLLRFTAADSTVLSSPVADKEAVADLVPGISQTQQSTAYFDALSEAIGELNGMDTDRKVLILISDGEDQTASYITSDNPIALIEDFKQNGGIVITLGTRSHGGGYQLLSSFATGGFFINAYGDIEEEALDYVSGIKGYICAGNCAAEGDTTQASGALNYCGFINWHVAQGHVDLVGNGFIDLIPGNGLYVDMAGSQEEYRGKLVSKAGFPTEAGKLYRLTLELAGNQRLDETPNGIEARVFSINADGVVTPAAAPVSNNSGSGSGDLESYEYAVSYSNAEGETPVSPAGAGSNGSHLTFTNTITHAGAGDATLARLWRRLAGTTRWYLIAESADTESPSFTDSLSQSALEAAITDGSIDGCIQPSGVNTTGTKNVRVSQSINVEDFTQGFETYSLSYTAIADEDVYISIQQTASPTGYEAIGLLLGSVKFVDVSDLETLLEDNFDSENLTYIPPACGTGSTYTLLSGGGYGYITGYDCYGTGCLDVPPPVQQQDPNPLSDIEAGYTPPSLYTATTTACIPCNPGFVSLSNTPLEFTTHSSSDASPEYFIAQLTGGAVALGYISLRGPAGNGIYHDLKVYGSASAAGPWTELLEGPADVYVVQNDRALFLIESATAYAFYKIEVSSVDYGGSGTTHIDNLIDEEMFFGKATSQSCATRTAESEISQADAKQKSVAAANEAALAALNCVAAYTVTESYTASCPAGTFGASVTKSATRTSLNSLTEAQAWALAAAQAEAEDDLSCGNSNNTQAIIFNNGTMVAANPYPSVKFISGMSGVVTKVTVTLKQIRHTSFGLATLLLRGPNGATCLLFRSDGMGEFVFFQNGPQDVTFDQTAATTMPYGNPVAGGTYRPTVLQAGADNMQFPAPAPATPYGLTLNVFNGIDPNGAWSLWAAHYQYIFPAQFITENMRILNGWDLTITAA